MKSPSKRYIIISWVLAVAWAGFIFYASAHTGSSFDNPTDIIGLVKKWLDGILAQANIPGLKESSSIGHFCEFAILGGLLANALHCHMPWRKACLLAVCLASVYGASDEFHQLFVPGRACDPADWVVDTLGASLGSALFWAFRTKVLKR